MCLTFIFRSTNIYSTNIICSVTEIISLSPWCASLNICQQVRHCVPQALVFEHSGQHLEIELFDEDPDKDDFLGRWFPALHWSYHTYFSWNKACCTSATWQRGNNKLVSGLLYCKTWGDVVKLLSGISQSEIDLLSHYPGLRSKVNWFHPDAVTLHPMLTT